MSSRSHRGAESEPTGAGAVTPGLSPPPVRRACSCAPGAFTVVELICALGIVLVLIGLAVPSVSVARESARRTRCLAQLGGHMQVLAVYASDFRDAWPYAFEEARRAPALPPHPEVRFWHPYNVVEGVWHLPVLDAYAANPFHESLLCPSDAAAMLEARDRFAAESGADVHALRGTLKYRMSMAMYLDARALRPESPAFVPEFFVGQTVSAVSFPAAKAALYECVPLHDRAATDPYQAVAPFSLTVAGVDGAARARNTGAMTPGIVFPGFVVEGFAQQQAEANKLRFTPQGVFGRDW